MSEQEFRSSQEARDQLQLEVAANVQALQLEQTRSEHALKILAQLAQREQRLREEQVALTPPDSDELERLRAESGSLEAQHCDKRAALDAEEASIPRLEQALREQGATVDAAAQQVTALGARIDALTQLQDRIARSETMQGWLATHDLNSARRLWQDIEIEAGWEDALEAVLRERLNAIGLNDLGQAAPWLGDLPPGKMTVYTAAGDSPVTAAPFGLEPLAAYVRCKNSAAAGALADWLDQVYVVKDRHEGLAVARSAAGRRVAGVCRRPRLHAPQRQFSCAGFRTAWRAVTAARDRAADRPARDGAGAAYSVAQRARGCGIRFRAAQGNAQRTALRGRIASANAA